MCWMPWSSLAKPWPESPTWHFCKSIWYPVILPTWTRLDTRHFWWNLKIELPNEMTCIRRHFWKRTTLRKKWKTIRPRPTEFETNYQFMLLKIMKNVRRVAVSESKAAEVILPRLAVLEPEIAKVICATAVVVKFRITSPVPSTWSPRKMLYLQRKWNWKRDRSCFEIARADNTNLVAVSNKNRFKFADGGPGRAVVIRNIIMLNQKLTSQLEELLKNLQRGFGILLLEFNRIRIGMEVYFGRYGYGFNWNWTPWFAESDLLSIGILVQEC